MKATLIWADGRREATGLGGGLHIIHHVNNCHRVERVTFTIVEGCTDWGEAVYTERSRKDVTEDMTKAQRENDERTWQYLRRGWGLDEPGDTWFMRVRRRFARWVSP